MLRKGWRDLSKFSTPVKEMESLIHDVATRKISRFRLKVIRYGIRRLRFRSHYDYGTLEVSFSISRSDETSIKMNTRAWFGRERLEFTVLASAVYDDPCNDSLLQDYLYSYMCIIVGNDPRLKRYAPLTFPDSLLDYISGEDYTEVIHTGFRFNGDPYFPFTVEKVQAIKSKPAFLDISST